MKNYTLTFILRKHKKKPNGTCPLYGRISVGSDRAEFSTKKYIKPADWNAKYQKVSGSSQYQKEINTYLDLLKVKALKEFNKLLLEDKPFTARELKDRVIGKHQEVRMILFEFDLHNQQIKELIGFEYAKATYTKYNRIRDCLAEFIKKNKGRNDIPFSDIDLEFIHNFEHFLKTKLNIGHNTTMKYLDGVKKLCLKAFNNGWIPRNPFANFRRTEEKKIPKFLDDQELKAIQELNLSAFERLDKVRDAFIFFCFTGLNYKDLKELTYMNIRHDGEEVWINTRRTKTKEPVRLILLPPARRIYEKYQTLDAQVSDPVMPVPSNQKCNAYLKEIADLARVQKHLTFHMSRHTFATTVTLNKGVPLEVVQILMGHSSRSSTEHYSRVSGKYIMNHLRSLDW